jgi:hypothetical protein
MKAYIPSIFFAIFLTAISLYSQPPFTDDCDEDDCIEKQGDFPPGPPDFDDPGFKGKRPPKLTEERIAKIMEMLNTRHPEFHAKLSVLKEKHPKIFERTLHKLRRFVKNEKKGPEDRQKLIEIFSDQLEFDLLLEKYSAETNSGKKEKIKAEMLKKMNETFEKKEQMKLDIIKNIEKNLEAKRQEFEKRKTDKNRIIKEDLEKIIRHHEKMEKEKN